MANELGISYDCLYNSLGRRMSNRPLRGDELLAICNFIGLSPENIINELKESEA